MASSSSSTVTYTVSTLTHGSPSPTLAAPVQERRTFENYLDIVQSLLDILTRHEDCRDFLSLRLHKKGAKLIHLAMTLDTPHALETITRKLDSLKAVLRNPIGNSMLNDPWMVNDSVWERCNLDRYRQCVSSISDLVIEAKPHVFAKEMITWIKGMNISSPPPSTALISAPVTRVNALGLLVIVPPRDPHYDPLTVLAQVNHEEVLDPATAQREIELFNCLAESAAEERQFYLIKQELKEQNRLLQVRLQETQVRREQQLIQLDEDCRSRTAQLQECVDGVRQSYLASKEILVKKQKATEETLTQTQETLSQSQAEIEKQKGTIGSLVRRVNDLQGQVDNMGSGGGGWCSIS